MLEPSKAKLICLENSSFSWEFQYNPKEFSLKRSSGFSAKDKADGPWGAISADCSKPDELSFEFVLDQTEPDLGMLGNLTQLAPVSSLAAKAQSLLNKDNVMEDVGNLYKMTIPHEDANKAKRPPLCGFLWGNFQFFGGVTGLDVKFVLFDISGLPRRAEVSMTMLGQAMHVPSKAEELFGNFAGTGYKYKKLKTWKTTELTTYGLRNALLGVTMYDVL